MKIQPIFKKQITELDFSSWERDIQTLMHSNFNFLIKSLVGIESYITDFTALCKITDKVRLQITAKVNGEDFYFNPAPQKKECTNDFEKHELLTYDLSKINEKIIILCESVKNSCLKVNQQQAERKKQEEQEKKEKERIKEIFDYSKRKRLERLISAIESSSDEEFEKYEHFVEFMLSQAKEKLKSSGSLKSKN